MDTTVLIVGAGPAGLALTRELARKGSRRLGMHRFATSADSPQRSTNSSQNRRPQILGAGGNVPRMLIDSGASPYGGGREALIYVVRQDGYVAFRPARHQ